MCSNPTPESVKFDLDRIQGHWFSFYDGLSVLDFHCLQINITERLYEIQAGRKVFQFKYGMRIYKRDKPFTGVNPFLYDDQQLLIFKEQILSDSDQHLRQVNVGWVHNLGEMPDSSETEAVIGNSMQQQKQILFTDYDDLLVVAFCDLSALTSSNQITKLISIYTRKNPATYKKQQVLSLLDRLYKIVQSDFSVSDAELKSMKLGHMLAKHHREKCPGESGFEDPQALSILELMEMHRREQSQKEDL